MREIEKAMLIAIASRKNWRRNNTEVEISSLTGEINVYLHGNLICNINNNNVAYNLRGWNTATTRSRINALGANVRTKNGVCINNDGSQLILHPNTMMARAGWFVAA